MNTKVAEILRTNGIDAEAFQMSDESAGEGVKIGPVPGAKALSVWLALRAAHPVTGVWPVIRGDWSHRPEAFEYDPASILGNVPTGSIREVLRPRVEEQLEMLGELIPDFATTGHSLNLDDLARRVDQSGIHSFGGKSKAPEPWPTHRKAAEIELHSTRDVLTRKTFKAVALSLVADAKPHEILARLGFGGWNECPYPELQVAVFREWGQKYGAVPICLTQDVLECLVANPPQTEADAFSLAAEQWIFCDDIVGQGTQTIRRLAIELWRSPQWFFWWD